MEIRFGITEKTVRFFMVKFREAMASSGKNCIDGIVNVDQFVFGKRQETETRRSYNVQKKKVVTAVQLTQDGRIKRMYAMKIEDFMRNHFNISL